MNRIRKYLLLMCLIVCMAIAGTACGKKNTNTMDKNTVYRESEVNLPLNKGEEVNDLQLVGDRMIFNGYAYDNTTYEGHYFVMSCKMDGTDRIEKDLTEGSANTWINRLFTSDGKVYALLSSYEEKWEGDEYFYKNFYTIKVMDTSLNVLKSIELSGFGDNEYFSNVCPVGEGKFLLYSYEKVYLTDENFKIIKSADSPENGLSNVYVTRSGKVIASYWGTSGSQMAYFDINTLTLGEKVNFPEVNYNFTYRQGTQYDFLFMDSQMVYGYNVGDSELTPLMNYINSDLSVQYFNALVQLEDGSFIGSYYDAIYSDYTSKVCRYTKVDPADVKDKKIITLGCLYMSYDVHKEVLEFNKNSEEYRITVKDYSMYNTEEAWNGGTEKLNSDIASGQSPDIVIADDTSTIANYISKGLFTDLTKYIDKDEEIKKEDIFPNLIEASSYKGKLCSIIPSFFVDTIVGKTSKLGNRTSWTMQEMLDFEKTLPEGTKLFYSMTRDSFLSEMLEVNSDYFVNMATGQCKFDSEEFIRLLEFCNTLPEEIKYDYEDVILYSSAVKDVAVIDESDSFAATFRSGKTVLMNESLYSFEDYRYVTKGYFDEDVTFIGYPSSNGNGSAINYSFALAISSKCADPDGAWQFVRHYLTKEYQDSITYGFPASMTAFAQLAEKAKERRSYEWEGEIYYYDDTFWLGNEEVEMDLLNDADIAKLKEVLMSATKLRGSVREIITIIDEEAQAFFAGQKSASDVAKIIQSRATIYINEKQ